MLDTKRILQLGIGVAVGMIAWHFIQKAMNGNGGTVGAFGKLGVQKAAPCRFVQCVEDTKPGVGWTGKKWCCKRNAEKCCAEVPPYMYDDV
jgi:hypothetical protein